MGNIPFQGDLKKSKMFTKTDHFVKPNSLQL